MDHSLDLCAIWHGTAGALGADGLEGRAPRENQMSFSKFDGKTPTSAVAMALAALASMHCGTSSGSGNDGTGGQSTSSTSSSGGAQATSTSTGMSDPACASAALCADVNLTDPTTCGGGSGGSAGVGGAESAGATNARCVLGKLRDRAPGYLAIRIDSGSPVPCGHVTELVSFGDGSVSISHRSYGDLAVSVDKSVREALKPAGYFEACLAYDDAAAIACLASLTLDAVVPGDTCPCRGNGSGPLSAYCSVGN